MNTLSSFPPHLINPTAVKSVQLHNRGKTSARILFEFNLREKKKLHGRCSSKYMPAQFQLDLLKNKRTASTALKERKIERQKKIKHLTEVLKNKTNRSNGDAEEHISRED